jgi:hypothetical protein
MDDRELSELIRRGASSWRGPSGSAAAARYANARPWTRWRYVAATSGAFAALLLAATAFAGGPGPALHTLVLSTSWVSETSPAPKQAPAPKVEPSPTSTPAPGTVAHSDATPTASGGGQHGEPTPPSSGHEPGSSPHPEASPSPKK